MSDAIRRPGEAQLLDDILLEDAPDPERIVRYADDPAALTEVERAEVESWLASSPRARDELAVLRRFDATAISRPAVPAARRAPPSRARFPRSLRAALPIAVAAAAVIAVLLVRPWQQGPTAPQLARAPEAPRTEPPRVPVPEPVPPRESAPLPSAPVAPRAEPAAPPAPEPVQSAPAEPEPIYVALLEPEYVAPWDVQSRARVTNEVRGTDEVPRLVALAPEHLAQTSAARPVLFWFASSIPVSGEWRLVVADPEAIDPLIQQPLPRPERRGVQRVALEQDLVPNVEYQWSIVWRRDLQNPASDVVAQGWVRRMAPPAELRAELAARPEHERAALYARASFWYDALAELDRVHRRFPDEPGPRRALAQLLAGVGLADLDLAEW